MVLHVVDEAEGAHAAGQEAQVFVHAHGGGEAELALV